MHGDALTTVGQRQRRARLQGPQSGPADLFQTALCYDAAHANSRYPRPSLDPVNSSYAIRRPRRTLTSSNSGVDWVTFAWPMSSAAQCHGPLPIFSSGCRKETRFVTAHGADSSLSRIGRTLSRADGPERTYTSPGTDVD